MGKVPGSVLARRGRKTEMTEFFEVVASARKIVKLLYGFTDKRACASGKAALARARSKTCRQVGSALGTRSVVECGTPVPLCL